MMNFMAAGGWVMWVVLVLSLVTLVQSFRFARNPQRSSGPGVRSFSTATVMAAVGGLATNLASVGYHVAAKPEWHGADFGPIVLQGIAESLAPVILGFSILTAAWVLLAIGARRLQAELE